MGNGLYRILLFQIGRGDMINKWKCHLCGSAHLSEIVFVKTKPKGEVDYGIVEGDYNRKIFKCNDCGVFNNFHEYDLDELYVSIYNDKVYNSNVSERYEQIMGLPLEMSDNKHRVIRVNQFAEKWFSNRYPKIDVLDVGSGLCVFLGEYKKFGIRAHCIDPSNISTEHAKSVVGVSSAHTSGFEEFKSSYKYDLISFNKVLEHVKNPVEFLKHAKEMLSTDGIVYIEIPDGENASLNGEIVNREEFYLEHYTIYNKESVIYLADTAGFEIQLMDSIHEPSDKYSIYALLSVKG